ncbi:MAG TPA: hypothetical protein PKM58_11205, partial [Pyrinomonadaceae bacterium]|nr:hypothetical protein [Pyrinomonadaceae bacterium]
IMKRNKLDSLVRNTQKAMSEFGKGLDLEQQKSINGLLGEAEEFVTSDDPMLLDEAAKKAEEAANQLTSALMVMA